MLLVVYSGSTRWHSWLRHCTSSRKVAGIIGIFHWQKSVPGIGPWGLGSRCVGLTDNLTTFMCRLSWNLGTTVSRPVQGFLYLFILQLSDASPQNIYIFLHIIFSVASDVSLCVWPNEGCKCLKFKAFLTYGLVCGEQLPSRSAPFT